MALNWPAGWPRTPAEKRRYGNFKRKGETNSYGYRPMRRVTPAEAWRDIVTEVRRMNAMDLRVDVSRQNKDGSPSSDARLSDDPGAVVHFRLNTRPIVIACDTFQDVGSNLRAIAVAIESKRRLLSYGFLDMEREFEGYAALPSGDPIADARVEHEMRMRARTAATATPPHVVLGIAEDAPLEVAEAAWKALAKKHHPDVPGGDAKKAVEVNEAIQAIRSRQQVAR